MNHQTERTRSLFRKEVIDSRRRSWLGEISVVQPVGTSVLAGFAILGVIGFVVLLAVGTYSRRSQVVGQLVPSSGMASVVAPTTGIITRLLLEEGAGVEMNQGMALVEVPMSTSSGDDARTMVLAGIDQRLSTVQQDLHSQNRLLDAQQGGYEDRAKAGREQLAQLASEMDVRQRQHALAKDMLRRYRELVGRGYVSAVQVQQQEQAMLDIEANLESLRRQRATIQSNVAELLQGLNELPARREVQQATSAREQALLRQERVKEDTGSVTLIKSPVKGTVTSRLVEPGQSVQAGQVLLSVLPEASPLQAQLYVPSRAAGFIKPGDRVMLRYRAFPYQKFGHHEGRVQRISRSASSREELGAVGISQETEPMYRVIVSLPTQQVIAYGHPESLRPGMLLDADVMGDERRLYEWLLEPLYAVRGHVAN